MKKLEDINPIRDRSILGDRKLLISNVINKILFTILIILLTGIILDIFFEPKKEPLLFFNLERVKREISEYPEKYVRELPSLSYYLNKINKRNLFKSDMAVPAKILPIADRGITPSDFILRGIALGARSQAIIENRRTRRTYFLHTGQSQNDLKVEEIKSGSVKLNYKGESFELFL